LEGGKKGRKVYWSTFYMRAPREGEKKSYLLRISMKKKTRVLYPARRKEEGGALGVGDWGKVFGGEKERVLERIANILQVREEREKKKKRN